MVLAAKLLGSCHLDKGAAVYSNLPAIDSKPPHYHRVYAHIYENQPPILDAAMEIFGTPEIASRDFAALPKRMAAKIDGWKKALNKNSNSTKGSGLEKKIYVYTRPIIGVQSIKI